MKRIIILLTVGALSFMLIAAGGQEKTTATVGAIISTLNNPFFVDLVEGLNDKAAELGYAAIVLDSQNDPAKELSNMEDLIIQNVAVILINPSDSDAAARSVSIAQEAGIPVVSIDRGVNGAEVNAHIASDNIAGGRMAGEYILAAFGSDAAIVELEGIPGSSAARDRGEGFNSVAFANVVVKQVANFDRSIGLSVMENIIQSNSNFNAVFAHNDEMALGAIKAIADAGLRDVMVVGFDATDDAREAVSNGSMQATIAQQPGIIGAKGVEVADKILKGESVDSFYPVELALVE